MGAASSVYVPIHPVWLGSVEPSEHQVAVTLDVRAGGQIRTVGGCFLPALLPRLLHQ